MIKEQAELNGQYRFVHSRLIANSEEVAFYGGEQVRFIHDGRLLPLLIAFIVD